MRFNIFKKIILFFIFIPSSFAFAWEGMPMPKLHVEGRYLKDSHGHIVNLHGFAQTYSPWFNEQNSKWSNYDVKGCLTYNKGIIDKILAAGWKMNFVRMHMDPYWSNTPGCSGRYEGEDCFNETRFKKYLDEVFVPMAEYAVSKGLYVVMRPPGVSPDQIEIDGVYHKYLIKVWGIVAKHPKLMNNANIMFELANEPIDILGTDGTYGAGTQGHFDNLKTYFQTIVNTIRATADNILWIPGLGFQSLYAGYAKNPIEGQNIGYAVHVYPGWFNSGQGYEPFQKGWDNQVQPVADFAPVIVTEMDWAPERHGKSWGKDSTGTAGGDGFGANFKKIADDCGNVSWLLFTGPELLAQYGNSKAPADIVDFLTDPEACPTPVYKWFEEYANEYGLDGASADYLTVKDLTVLGDENITILTKTSVGLKINALFADGHTENVSSLAEITVDNPNVVNVVRGRIFALEDGQAILNITYTDSNGTKLKKTLKVTASTFPLTSQLLNPSIFSQGTFDEATHTLITGQWGFGGWWYSNALDLTGYKYLVARLGADNKSSISFRVFDENSYWSGAAEYNFGSKREVVVTLANMVKAGKTTKLDPSHIYIVGFWSSGNSPIVIDSVFLSNSSEYGPPVGIDQFSNNDINEPLEVDVYNIMGTKIRSKVKLEVATEGLQNGVYLVGRKKVMVCK
jgi:prepilin-type processing-associated H-X9-DG protein